MIVPVQCNHHLVRLPFELRSYYCARTDNHSSTRHYPAGTMGYCTKLLLSRFLWELVVLPWRLQGFPLWFEAHTQSSSVCLNHTVFGICMISKKLYFNLSKCVDNLLVVKTLIKILNIFNWLKILNTSAENIRYFS